ncbi:Uncharacterised protein [Mycobacterium tuberculosis]|uniref:Uncharacterized protein n=1 Tax=Mycobacterium tuberculosis TaxID=1773 RepID=A0A655JPY3_MYCTX|nr:Uncharacterised protein [Mycobacterium tuberculosis]
MRRPGGGGGRSVFGVPGQQFPNDGVLLGAGKQPRQGVTGALCGLAQDRIGVAVHGAYHRFADRRPARAVGARPQQRRRQRTAGPHAHSAGTGQQQNRLRVGAGADVSDRGLNQQCALTGARAAQHKHRTAQTRREGRTRLDTPDM